ncbi:MAG: N-acetylglucosamine-6-phosphate deacetylase [Sinobacteraceae bacterium]|nr:N-acetylglucosamine-6-phosphate deacetylase [Nevskiaceae bacterium]
MSVVALRADRVLLAEGFVPAMNVLVENGRVTDVCADAQRPHAVAVRRIEGDLVPGFIDLQVNGGDGVLFNDRPDLEGVRRIAAAHRRLGTTGLLPTVISDELDVVAEAIRATDAAIEAGVPGVLGRHIEGPFINVAKRGIHAAAKIRTLDDRALELLCSARFGRTLVTLAPEQVPSGAIRELVRRGVIVAAGHTLATYAQLETARQEGLCGFTHVFNAMSPLGSREPGAVGAAADFDECWASVIADGEHVHGASLRWMQKAKGVQRLALVSDAMPPVGTAAHSFTLQGSEITVSDGRCTDSDGTLAGSMLDMASAVRRAMGLMRIDQAIAVRMATSTPATVLGLEHERGQIAAGYRADLVWLSPEGAVREVWVAGETG